MIKKLILFFTIALTFYGCTRDDICPDGTPTTPLLIITFNDIANPLVAKEVTSLTVDTDYTTSVRVIDHVQTDSIAIPLRPGDDSTQYRFILDEGETSELIDIYEFSYDRLNVYVNRACGFKTTYSSLSAGEDLSGPIDWIIDININKTTVEDETAAHITILH